LPARQQWLVLREPDKETPMLKSLSVFALLFLASCPGLAPAQTLGPGTYQTFNNTLNVPTGLRSAFSFTVPPGQTGQLFIGVVGNPALKGAGLLMSFDFSFQKNYTLTDGNNGANGVPAFTVIKKLPPGTYQFEFDFSMPDLSESSVYVQANLTIPST
jgi:hypothetical protein